MGKAVDQRAEATRLGSYEIVRKLARGGMAELYIARSVGPEGFEKVVVLKKILPDYAANPKFVKLFLDEAKIAATLDHPHIAQVYDMGTVDGNYFFTMEYVHGQDVRTTLRRTSRLDRKFPVAHAVQIASNIAAALHYAHERRRADGTLLGIVHRDVSPSNVLVSYDGAVKLVDFGVAKAATSTVKTRTGTLKGKIAYMSPEQAKGAPVDRRSDVFSLGIMLWEMVTTQRLFKADNDLATIQQIINSKPQPPSQLRPECSPELEQIILRALSADPETRYQTAEELQLVLEELAREQRLTQSTVALRAHMHELFADEIAAWKHALASGQTLTDTLVSNSVAEMTTPVSENEISYLDDDDDEEDDSEQLSQQGTIELSSVASSTTAPIEVSERPSAPIKVLPPSVIVRVDHTPLKPVTATPPNAVPIVSLPAIHPVAPIVTMSGMQPLSGIHALSQQGQPTMPVVPLTYIGPRPGDQGFDVFDVLGRRKRAIIIGASCGLGLIILIAIVFGGGDDTKQKAEPPAAGHVIAPAPAANDPAIDEAPTAVETTKTVDTKPAPPPVETAIVPPLVEVKPAETKPAEIKPSITKPADKTTKPADKTTKPADKITKPADKPIAKPAETRPVTKPHTNGTPTVTKPPHVDKKPSDKKPPKDPKHFDPTSALPQTID